MSIVYKKGHMWIITCSIHVIVILSLYAFVPLCKAIDWHFQHKSDCGENIVIP